MAKLKILVSAVGGDLGQSVVKCLRDSNSKPTIWGCDMNPYAGGKKDVDEFYQSPPVDEKQQYQDFLLDNIARGKINYVFLLAEVEIIFFNEHREIFQDTGATFVVSEKAIIDTFMDKYRTVQFFKEKGIAYPMTWLPPDYQGQLGYPLILKKRRGSGGQRLFKVNDEEELHFYLKRHQDMIIQEYLPGNDNEYTAGLFSDGESLHTITFKRTLAPGGFSQQVEVMDDETITQFPLQLAQALEFKGSLNVQFRKTERGCIPFEINPRFSSTVYFRHCFGFKDVWWWLEVLAGRRPAYPSVYKKGVGVKKFSEAIFNLC